MTINPKTPSRYPSDPNDRQLSLSERLAAIRNKSSAPASGEAVRREFPFTAKDFERVKKLIYGRAGISLTDSKQDMVYSRLARRLRAKNMKNFSEYLDVLERDRNVGEWELFINSLTTNLTSFFRESHHFPILADHLRKVALKRNQINIWCCAASTGEEPYSIAITVADAFASKGGGGPQISIFCSDLDTNVLETAEKGEYPRERVAQIPAAQLQRYFRQGSGDKSGFYTVLPELRRMMAFKRVNLLDPVWPLRGPLDVIFCRNVMIYFDKATQHKILSRFAPLLQKDGLLFAGHSENFLHAVDLFRSQGKTVYELSQK